MYTFDKKTTLVGVSELRTKIDEILKTAKDHKVLIGKRNKLMAVLLDIEKYNQMEKALEFLEDFALGYLAKERERNSNLADYIDAEKAEEEI
ncbi:MAG: type II toxin-antitoxin system Phd/YefM family antitoxin [Candidatus Ratteibacteria bacterium]|nr:type II toxin-antitoxin system Phd/YefM family antitoxin [Candidatus Ratteibacteria bacterium]